MESDQNTTTISTTGWPDRYRPDTLADVALAPELRQRFERYLAGRALPRHLILHGPPGFGKTTLAQIIARTSYGGGLGVRWVKSTESGNVETIRRDVINYMRGQLGPRQKLLVFEEATGLTPEAQDALKVPLEEWTDLCRVIFITNDVSKLNDAIRSRCDEIELKRPPIQECARVLEDVLKAEGIEPTSADVLAFTRGHFHAGSDDDRRDLRSLLASAQHDIEVYGALPVAAIPSDAERSLEMEEAWERGTPAEPTDGAKLLADLADQFSKYVSLPRGGAEALALWTVFGWAHEAFSISPILALVSPTMRAGKSTVFEILEQLLIPETFHPSSITPAVLYRLKGLAEKDQAVPPQTARKPELCLLIDEADLLKPGGVLRAVLNSGHARRSAFVHRMISTSEVGKFSSWYPKAMALIDRPSSPFPDTLRDRSIMVPMQRMKNGETKPKFPRHQALPELRELSTQTASWVRGHFTDLRELGGQPIFAAEELNSRARDNWHPLMCIARVAGGDWEDRARRASVVLSDATRETELLVELLASIRDVFEAEEGEALRSVTLVQKLAAMEAGPWKEHKFNTTKLSKMLRPLRIRPKQLWMEFGLGRKENKQGYERAQFEDAFARYL